MPIVSCNSCDEQFHVKPNRLVRGWGKYCSNECKHLGLKSGSLLKCTECDELLYRNRNEVKRSGSGEFFCNRSCRTKWRNKTYAAGSRHPNWKGGKSVYRKILGREDRLLMCEKCHTADSRVLAVHHKDRHRQNNSVTNLIWLCHNCHYLVHHFANESVGFIVGTAQGKTFNLLRE